MKDKYNKGEMYLRWDKEDFVWAFGKPSKKKLEGRKK